MYTITVQALVHVPQYLLKVFFWKRLTNSNSYDPGWIKIPVDEVGAIHEFYIMSLSEQTLFRPIKIH